MLRIELASVRATIRITEQATSQAQADKATVKARAQNTMMQLNEADMWV